MFAIVTGIERLPRFIEFFHSLKKDKDHDTTVLQQLTIDFDYNVRKFTEKYKKQKRLLKKMYMFSDWELQNNGDIAENFHHFFCKNDTKLLQEYTARHQILKQMQRLQKNRSQHRPHYSQY